jgi:hypothetical protein
MIIGNPYDFAIGYDVVDEWNIDDNYTNGILNIYIDGINYCSNAFNATISGEISYLINRLSDISENKELFCLSLKKLIKYLLRITFPSNIKINNCYDYYVTPEILADNNYYFFAVSYEKKVRIIAIRLTYNSRTGKVNLLKNSEKEIILSSEYLKKITEKLKQVSLY